MNLIWKGKFKDNAQLDHAELPDNAVKFQEPDTLGKFLRRAMIFAVPVLLLAFFFSGLKAGIYGSSTAVITEGKVGLLLSVLPLLPHELMHAALFPKGAPVELWYSLSHGAAFVYCTKIASLYLVYSLTWF